MVIPKNTKTMSQRALPRVQVTKFISQRALTSAQVTKVFPEGASKTTGDEIYIQMDSKKQRQFLSQRALTCLEEPQFLSQRALTREQVTKLQYILEDSISSTNSINSSPT